LSENQNAEKQLHHSCFRRIERTQTTLLMNITTSHISSETLKTERLKGARYMVYFRWLFIALIVGLLIIQVLHGYKSETMHSLILVSIYAISNIALQFAISRQYDRAWLRYMSAFLDVGIISFHLWHLSGRFDPIAVSAAATILLYPIMILLYTFRIDRKLLVFITVLSVLAYSAVFVVRYPLILETGIDSLSISPLSQFFKSLYILFIGMICLFLQSRLTILIAKQTEIVRQQTEADMQLRIEQERNQHIEMLMARERQHNLQLEKEIAERVEAETQLKERDHRFRLITENLHDMIWTLDLRTMKFTYISPSIYKMRGYTPEEAIAIPVGETMSPESYEFVVDSIENALQQYNKTGILPVWTGEMMQYHKNGSPVWVEVVASLMKEENGSAFHVMGVSRDITSKKLAEQSYKELTDFLPQTIYELDNEGYILFKNKAADKLFGLGKTDEFGRISALQYFIPEDHKRMAENIRYKETSDSSIYNEYTAIRADGSLCPVMIYSSPIYREGKRVGSRGIIIDISARKKIEEDLKTAKHELEELNARLEQKIEERTSQLTEANTQVLRLQKENLQSQFDMLKQQVNPHFLFNSLNVLTSLIKPDPDLAESFTVQLAKVYRYVLENKDKDLVPVSTEMDFLRAYVFLLDIRFMGKVNIDIDFDEEKEDRMLLPLSLQMLIENAIKHNTFSRKNPLSVRLFIDDNQNFVVENNLQSRETNFASTGVGLKNIQNRYALLTDKPCSFEKTETHYIARIPLLTN
jgi:PAS domain S-box-containing protein